MKALIRGALHANDIEMSGLMIEKHKISDVSDKSSIFNKPDKIV